MGVVNYGFEWSAAWCHAGCWCVVKFPTAISPTMMLISDMKSSWKCVQHLELRSHENLRLIFLLSYRESERDVMNGGDDDSLEQLATKSDSSQWNVNSKRKFSHPRTSWNVMAWMKTAVAIVFDTKKRLFMLKRQTDVWIIQVINNS